jgi:hypothetical protein
MFVMIEIVMALAEMETVAVPPTGRLPNWQVTTRRFASRSLTGRRVDELDAGGEFIRNNNRACLIGTLIGDRQRVRNRSTDRNRVRSRRSEITKSIGSLQTDNVAAVLLA